MSKRTRSVMVLLIITALCLGADIDPQESFRMIMAWQKPNPYPRPMLEGMDIPTLSTMLDSGNLQWYEPRPEKETWEGVVGMKIHAPPETVWEIMTDHELQCKIMADTFDYCKTESREGNEVRMEYKIHTSVLMYSFKMDMVDVVKEDPPHHMHINTVEGQIKGREIDILLVPMENNTLIFMRYYSTLKGINMAMRLLVAALPMSEPPTSVGAANYHARSYKNEAEKRVGYNAPKKPGPLQIENLDIKTLRLIDSMNGGLIRETPDGKIIDALAFTFVDAPPERVWEVATDFEHYDQIFKGSKCEIESRDGNTVIINQKMASFSVLLFDFGFEFRQRYKLEPPDHLSYVAIGGNYEGSRGELRLKPLENGTKTLIFGSGGINLDHDDGLVSRIAKTGAFPLENMLNMTSAQSLLAFIRIEAQKREGG